MKESKKKKKKDKKEKKFKLTRLSVNANMPIIKPEFKEKFTKTPLKKLRNAIKTFIRSLSKKKKELRKLLKTPITEINIHFDGSIPFLNKKKIKTNKKYTGGHIEIEDNRVLSANVFKGVLNPKKTKEEKKLEAEYIKQFKKAEERYEERLKKKQKGKKDKKKKKREK